MNSYGRFAKIAAVLSLVALLGQAVSAQQVSRRQRWEYCAIINSSFTNLFSPRDATAIGVASICYFQSTGCRMEEVKFDLDLAQLRKTLGPNQNEGYLSYAAREKVTQGALSRAITKLGDDGWEMIGQSVKFGDEPNPRAIYFKRRK